MMKSENPESSLCLSYISVSDFILVFYSNTLGKLLNILSLILLAYTMTVIRIILSQTDIFGEFFDAVTWTPVRIVLIQVNKISLFAMCHAIFFIIYFPQ